MPLRSKKSRAKKAQWMKQKTECTNNSVTNVQNAPTLQIIKQISGNFHQGDKQFSEESRGRQCSCNALAMLLDVESMFSKLQPRDLDEVLINGDQLYKVTANKLYEDGELENDKYLGHDQLPTTVTLKNCSYTVDYKELRYGSLDENETRLETLDTELQHAFIVSNKNILIFGSYMMALYKDSKTDQFLFFDSHSRNEHGFVDSDGSAIALYFADIHSLLTYLYSLSHCLNLTLRNFGILPIDVYMNMEIHDNFAMLGTSNDVSTSVFNVDRNVPDLDCDLLSARKESRWHRWYANLPKEEQEMYKNQNKEQHRNNYHRNIDSKRQAARKRAYNDYKIPEKRIRTIANVHTSHSKQRRQITNVIKKFQKRCQDDQPVYACKICNRIQFKSQVVQFVREKYNKTILLKALSKGTYENVSDSWICKTCHVNIKKGDVPRLASTNKLGLCSQPLELSTLNMLERHLICPSIPFMKMISLIKGSQKGIHGQVVCVKADLHNTVQCLPRLPTDESLIRVKLKKKLQYKSHHMCQDINPSKVRQALGWLKGNNSLYEDIEIDFANFNSMLDDQLIQNEDTNQNSQIHHDTLHDDTESHADCGSDMETVHDTGILENTFTNQSSSTENYSEAHDNLDQINDHSENNTEVSEDKKDKALNDDVTNTSAPLYSFLHPVDFAQYLADKHDTSILSLAPAERNSPQKVLQMEAECFPVEFPDGLNTYKEERQPKVSPSAYFKARLFSLDNRFARNPEYIFFAQYATEVHQINSGISIALRIGATKTADGKPITASLLSDQNKIKELIKRDEGYRFLTQVRGTPAYWEKSKKNLFAMIRQLGIPTFFVTFSAADRRWIEIPNAILAHLGKRPMTPEEHKNMTWEDHCRIIMENPVIAATMFYNRVKVFISDVIQSPAKPIGEVVDYYYRTEFQQRGWPHIHMVVWVKDAPKLDESEDDEITQFVDKYISCEMPPETDSELYEIVTSVQVHTKNHTKSCRKTGKNCRFNFPRPPSNRTFICRPVKSNDHNKDEDNDIDTDCPSDDDANAILLTRKNAEELLKKVWELLLDANKKFATFKDVLKAASTTQSSFEENLAICSNKQTIYLRRKIEEQWINNYNPYLIRCWNGNMDIQYVMDGYACVMYILSYITKAEREMGDLLRNAQREAAEGNTDAITQLRRLGSLYLHHREISVMGAIYTTCRMPLQMSTRKVVFIQTDSNGQKISLPLKVLQENAGKSEQAFQSTQIDKYLARPNTAKFNNMCMAEFFSQYHFTSIRTNSDAEEDLDNEETGDCHVLENNCGKIKERTGNRPAIIRYPRVSVKKDSERFHMNMLRLYLPHRDEKLKPDNYVTYESYHLTGYQIINSHKVAVQTIVNNNMKEFEPDTEQLDDAWEAVQEAANLQDAWAAIAPQSEQQRLDDQLEKNMNTLDSDDDIAEIEIPELASHMQNDQSLLSCGVESVEKDMTDDQVVSMLRQLNEKQRQLFNHVTKWCRDKVQESTTKPFHIFLTGGAGTGKSHVIKCVKHHAQKTFASLTESPDDVTVLLVAHTGTAAYNISGETICSTLRISPKVPQDYRPLAESSLNTLRARFHHLQLIIIDEISMVSTTQLSYIHGRLQQIKGLSDDKAYFGNVSVLAVGDFYQLPPISPPTPICFPHKEILKDLWNPNFEIWELSQIMRQRDDLIFAQMLNRLRIREKDKQLQEADEKLLMSRVVKEGGLSAPSHAMHIYARNADVDDHNKKKLDALSTQTHTIKAIDTKQIGGHTEELQTPHKTTRKDTSLVPELNIAVGARAMLITNIDVSDGLSNGVSGIIKGILYGTSPNMPKAVFVEFDSSHVGVKSRTTQSMPIQYSTCVAIKPHKETISIKGKTYTITREQIPLKLAWAVTVHKVQGQTTEQAVISLKHHTKAMAYVALSRVTNLNGLYLTDYDSHRIFCNKDIATEMDKMPICDLTASNPLMNIDHNKYFIIAHHNVQSLSAHIEDLRANSEICKAHIICVSETWLQQSTALSDLQLDGYDLNIPQQLPISGRGKGVAIFVQKSIDYEVLPFVSETYDLLVIRTKGKLKLVVVTVYKPIGTNIDAFRREINEISTQVETLDIDYNLFLGDFNHNLINKTNLPLFQTYHQVITKPTTKNGTLLDHIYVKPSPDQYRAEVLSTYYSYHDPVAIAIKY